MQGAQSTITLSSNFFCCHIQVQYYSEKVCFCVALSLALGCEMKQTLPCRVIRHLSPLLKRLISLLCLNQWKFLDFHPQHCQNPWTYYLMWYLTLPHVAEEDQIWTLTPFLVEPMCLNWCIIAVATFLAMTLHRDTSLSLWCKSSLKKIQEFVNVTLHLSLSSKNCLAHLQANIQKWKTVNALKIQTLNSMSSKKLLRLW